MFQLYKINEIALKTIWQGGNSDSLESREE